MYLTELHKGQRTDLEKLINLLKQIQLLEDLDIFGIAFKFPDQLSKYIETIGSARDNALKNGVIEEEVTSTRILENILNEVLQNVIHSSDTLS